MTVGVGADSEHLAAASPGRAARPPRGAPWNRSGWSLLLAFLCAGILGLRVHGGFERSRLFAALPQTVAASALDIPLPDLDALADRPAALIVRVRGAGEPTRLRVAIGQEVLTIVPLPAAKQTRIDTVFLPKAGAEYRLTLTADRPGWQVESIEASNVHGYSSGLLSFVVVPRSRPHDAPLPRWLLVPILAGLLALRPSLDWPHRAWRLLHGIGAGAVLLLFGAVLLAPAVTPYSVLLAPSTIVLCLAILYAHALPASLRALVPDAARQSRAGLMARRLLPHAVLAILLLWSVAQFHEPGLGFTRLIAFGEDFQPRALPALRALPRAVDSERGYDGQFYAQIALDPLLRSGEIAKALDSTGYRARRVLFSWTAWLAGAGDPWRVVQAYALQNVVSWLLMAILLLRWLPPDQPRAIAAWAGCMFSAGMLQSIQLSLLDGPSMLLLAVGVVAIEKQRWWIAAGILGASGLGRETNVLGATILADGRRPDLRGMARLALGGILVLAPLLLWLAHLSSLGYGSGTGVGNFAPPFAAYAGKWASTLQELLTYGWNAYARHSLMALLSLTIQAAFLAWRREWQNPWWRLGIGSMVLMPFFGAAVWEGYPGAVTRILLPMTFAFNILLPRSRWFWPLWILGNASALSGLRALEVPLFGTL